jgi:thiol-disulfide isomerase/thioredoxin
MKNKRIIVAFILACTIGAWSALPAQSPGAAISAPQAPAVVGAPQTTKPVAEADRDWAALLKIMKPIQPDNPKDVSKRQRILRAADRAKRQGEACWDFYTRYPTHPRRWNVALIMIRMDPSFVKDFAPDFDQTGHTVIDEEAKAAWQKNLDAVKAALESAADVPQSVQADLEGMPLKAAVRAAQAQTGPAQGAAIVALLPKVQAYLNRFQDEKSVTPFIVNYLYAVGASAPAELENVLGKLAASPHAEVRASAKDRLRAVALLRQPFQMKFTAIDGREVDMMKLRGKVVLIDFWATWCGPCIAELPNVKAVYEKYHAQGFEVVSISLDEQRARSKLVDFVRENHMPWPQHFDGKGWKNEFAVQYAINAIPAMFLLDVNGMIISIDARGKSLEPQVRQALGLSGHR